jgi:hypothetical protein
MIDALRRLVVDDAPADWIVDSRHATLIVRPEIAVVQDSDGRSLVEGLDVNDPATWGQISEAAVDVASQLARIAVDVLPDLLANAKAHGCDWMPRPFLDDHDAEIRRGSLGDGCTAYLSATLGDYAAESGHMPFLEVRMPRNRVQSWRARLTDAVAALAQGTADSLDVDWLTVD